MNIGKDPKLPFEEEMLGGVVPSAEPLNEEEKNRVKEVLAQFLKDLQEDGSVDITDLKPEE
jgi:F0F1-type ATP synthase delta subunit